LIVATHDTKMGQRARNGIHELSGLHVSLATGNATVALRPEATPDGALILDSSGLSFGDAGFYRMHAVGADSLRVWHIRTLKERFQVFVDDAGTLRCDHTVRFLGMPVLSLHDKMLRRTEVGSSPG
jgi:hypothetical protein